MREFMMKKELETNSANIPKPKRGKRFVDPNKVFVVHPDMGFALKNYNGDRETISKVFKERDELVEKGEKYWNDLHDQEFLETAWERSHNPGWWLGLLDDEFTYSGDMARQVDMMEDND